MTKLFCLLVLFVLLLAGAEPHRARPLARRERVHLRAWQAAGRRWGVRIEVAWRA